MKYNNINSFPELHTFLNLFSAFYFVIVFFCFFGSLQKTFVSKNDGDANQVIKKSATSLMETTPMSAEHNVALPTCASVLLLEWDHKHIPLALICGV